MASGSFKPDLNGRPLRYRTPSPPAFEFTSPATDQSREPVVGRNGLQWSNNSPRDNSPQKSHPRSQTERNDAHQRSLSGGAMDAFASIALATEPNGQSYQTYQNTHVRGHNGTTFVNMDGQVERPAKRARSEKLPSPEVRRFSASKGARPATSYGQSSNISMDEAELFLNFVHGARLAVPHKTRLWSLDSVNSAEQTASHSLTATIPGEQEQETEGYGATGPPTSDNNTMCPPVESALRDVVGSDYSQAAVDASEPSEQVQPPVDQASVATIAAEPAAAGDAQQLALVSRNADEGEPTTADEGQHRHPKTQSAQADSPHVSDAEPPPDNVPTDDIKTHVLDNHHEVAANVDVYTMREIVASCEHQTNTGFTGLSREDTNVPKHPESPGLNDPSPEEENFDAAAVQQTTNSASNGLFPSQASMPENTSLDTESESTSSTQNPEKSIPQDIVPAVCAACNFSRSTIDGEADVNSTSWISCDACKSWFHFACADFKNEREVRGVDKYRCRKCKPVHGPTTFVRKSARAHSAIDYAGLHQGVIKTSDETPEHHYIKPIKEGTITFQPETFARIRPELVNAEYVEKGYGWKEPIVIPAAWNPRHQANPIRLPPKVSNPEQEHHPNAACTDQNPEEWDLAEAEADFVPDHGQDALDMVMPQGLTVRAVAELYGPEEKVEVIDVKSQNGEGKKWNMKRWAEYYESKGNKIVRNVISLEVSRSKLGRLIRRPQIVRDLDLQDSVWPAELQAKGEIPRVQFYCLMSVADCFTDFHIDFGGSSVFYHILKGKKTFFFIPPKEKHLKKYEEWCLSPAQNWTFLGDQTKECYRVDLSEGDTMLIPAGWIHAVWTPEDSLVIGGNFLTRLSFGMQLRISQIEKATGVARKFRYPHFQKIQWYTAFRYMEEDPLPTIVQKLLQEGEIFYREQPAHHEFDDWGENSKSGLGNYHARYYSQAELEGLPDLTRYLLRTALIDLGSITDGITQETRNAVKRSIPRGHGEPLEVVKKFAAWCAWKRGNEPIPSWAYPDVIPEPESVAKLSAAAQKKLDKEAALHAPRRQSARMQSQHSTLNSQASTMDEGTLAHDDTTPSTASVSEPTLTTDGPQTPTKRKLSDPGALEQAESVGTSTKKRRTASATTSASHRKVACESCRKRRRACKHKDTKDVLYPDAHVSATGANAGPAMAGSQTDALADLASNAGTSTVEDSIQLEALSQEALSKTELGHAEVQPEIALEENRLVDAEDSNYLLKTPEEMASTPKMLTHLSGAGLLRLEHRIAGGPVNGLSVLSLNAPHSRGRTKACNDCRKSKRRCIHDEYGNEDPVKAREAAIPRPAAANKRRKMDSEGNEIPSTKRSRKSSGTLLPATVQDPLDSQTPSKSPLHQAPTANMIITLAAVTAGSSLYTESQAPSQNEAMFSAFDQIQAAAEPMHEVDPPSAQFPDRQSEEHAANPPAPAARSCTTFPGEAPSDQHNKTQATSSPVASAENDCSIPIDPALENMPSSFSVPAASLVSPPASSHAGASHTPPSPSAISSRHSSRHPKQIVEQRYTPESGPRRNSSSSVDEIALTSDGGRAGSMASEVVPVGKDTSPITMISTTADDGSHREVAFPAVDEDERKEEVPNLVNGEVERSGEVVLSASPNSTGEPKGEPTRRKSRSSMEDITDEESLRLIKQLQAQEYGLRRRGKFS